MCSFPSANVSLIKEGRDEVSKDIAYFSQENMHE